MNTLQLDPRQRAMLDEMGVKVWWPLAEPAAAPVDAIELIADSAGRTGAKASFHAENPVSPPVPPAAVARPAIAPVAPPPRVVAPTPQTAGATVLVDGPLRLYSHVGPATGGWLVIADMPPEADGRHGEAFNGDAGRLLDNMLRALRLHQGTVPVHLMRSHRGSATGQPASPMPLATQWAKEASALAPRIVLAMGPLAAQTLLQAREPLGKLRGRVWPLVAGPHGAAALPLVATYHPAYLLRNGADKARAWADLCLAAAELDAPVSPDSP